MKVKILNDHESGLVKGTVYSNLPSHIAEKLVFDGIAEEVGAKENKEASKRKTK